MDKKTFTTKYNNAIRGIAEKNNVDLGVAGDMFIYNARVIANAANKAGKDWYKGMGALNIDALISDENEYEKSIKKEIK